MDGFHPANAERVRLGRRERKGAPDTFGASGYVALLRRLVDCTENVVYAPVYDRALGESVNCAVPVAPQTRLVVTEGNYLLLDDGPWAGVRPLLDEIWFCEVCDAGAVVVRSTRGRADLVVPEAVLAAPHPA